MVADSRRYDKRSRNEILHNRASAVVNCLEHAAWRNVGHKTDSQEIGQVRIVVVDHAVSKLFQIVYYTINDVTTFKQDKK